MSIGLNNSECQKCGLCTTRTKVFNGLGNPQAKILFVVDKITHREVNSNKHIQGLNEILFNNLLRAAGISKNDVFFTSATRCDGYIKKPKDHFLFSQECFGYLEQEVQQIKPNIIVPIGADAAKAVFQTKTFNISKGRGTLRYSKKLQCKVIPILHPGFLIQNPAHEDITVLDLKAIKAESTCTSPLPTPVRNHKTILTIEDFNQFLVDYSNAPVLASDIESTGKEWLKDKIIGISFSKVAGEAVYIPFIKGQGNLEDYWEDNQSAVYQGVKRLLEGPSAKIFHNGSFDIKILKANMDIHVCNFAWDTLLMDHVLYENAKGLHGLEDCAYRFTDFGNYKTSAIDWFEEQGIPKDKRDFSLLPTEILYPYAANDSDATFTLYDIFKPKLKEQDLLRLFNQVTMPLQRLVIEVEYRGIEIDTQYLNDLGERYRVRLIDLEQQIYKLVGTFKITSGKQLQKVLFVDLKLKATKKTPSGGWSTDKEALEPLKGKHPVIDLLVDYKLIKKLLSTYVEGLQEKLDSNNRLHTNYLLFGTTTGRLSSVNPGLQNIPARTNDIQLAFLPGADRVFIAADYAAAEFACIRGDQRVLMADSTLKCIKDIQVGDKVWSVEELPTFRSRRPKIATVQKVIYQGKKACQIVQDGTNTLVATSDHKFLRRRGPFSSNSTWKPVNKGDRCYTFPQGAIPDIREYIRGTILGLYLTDGTVSNVWQNNMQLSISQKDPQVLNWVKDQLRKDGIKSSLGNNAIHVYGQVAVTKFLEQYKYTDNFSYIRGFISGLLLGDGWFGGGSKLKPSNRATLGLSIVHPEVLDLTYKALNRIKEEKKYKFEYTVYNFPIRKDKDHKPFFHFIMQASSMFLFPIVVPCDKQQRMQLRIEQTSNLQTLTTSTVDIAPLEGLHDTYDLTTSEGTFVCENYVVHNCWANFSKDPQMKADIEQGKEFDIHRNVGSVVFGIPKDQITKDQRNLAKTCLFGKMYGRGPNSVAEQFKVPVEQAKKILDYVQRRYPVGFRWLAQQQHEAQRVGYTKTHFGRIRHLQPLFNCLDEEIRAKALRLALNSPIQGTIGDLTNIAALRVTKRFQKEGIDGYLALNIHDALVFSVPKAQEKLALAVVQEEMERPVERFSIPMRVEIKVGPTWGSVHKLEDEVPVVEEHEDLEEELI